MAPRVRTAQRSELRACLSAWRVEDLAGVSRHSGTRLEKVERGLAAHERTIRRAEEHLKALTHHGPQYSQLEGALLNLERQVNEQQVAVEVQVARLQVECDGLRRRSEAIAHTREELVEAVEERLARATVSEPRAAPRDDSRLLQRCDDLDARLAAQKVHVEAHEQRFKSFAERLEAVQMELFDQLRSFGVQRREELLQEVDGQLRVLRERMDTLSELLDEIMLRQAVEGRKGHFVRPLPRIEMLWEKDLQRLEEALAAAEERERKEAEAAAKLAAKHSSEDSLLVNKQCILVLAQNFTAKRVRTSEWKARRRGTALSSNKALVKANAKKGKEEEDGEELIPIQDAEEESPEALAGVFCCHDFDALLVFSERGFVYILQALDVPLVKKSFCKGTELKAFLPELEGRVAALVTVAQGRLKDQEDFVVLVSLSRFRALRPGKGMPAMKLAEGDQLAWAHKAGANSAMVLGTAEGFVLRVSLGQDPVERTTRTSPPAPRRGRGRRSGSAVRAIPGDAANRVRRLKALGPERVKQEEEEKRQQASVEPLTAVRAEQLDALGVALLAQGRPQEAEEAFRQSLQLASLVDAEWAANNLAVSLKAQGSERYGEAEEFPEILTSLNNLAVLLKAEGQLPEAEELYRQALSGRRRALGDLHPDTLTSINNLATLLASTGRSDEAETLYFEALEGCRKTLGEDDLDTRSGGVLVGLVGPCWLGDHGDLLLCDLEVRVP
eukprot:g32817.t1